MGCIYRQGSRNINAKRGRWILGQLKLYFLPSSFSVIALTSVADNFLNLLELFLERRAAYLITSYGIVRTLHHTVWRVTPCGILVQSLGLNGSFGSWKSTLKLHKGIVPLFHHRGI